MPGKAAKVLLSERQQEVLDEFSRSCQGTSILTQLGDTNCYAVNRQLQTAWSPELASLLPS